MADRLTPGAIAKRLFGIDPDRDERASQLCAETLLTLAQNGYGPPPEATALQSPKRERFALRSLALGENFLVGRDSGRAGDGNTTPERYGQLLASADQIRGSASLDLARDALQGLLDAETHRGQPGGWLLLPFHESLLWYDARRVGSGPWGVRKVYMRGSGITMARMLIDPRVPSARALGNAAVHGIMECLTSDSPVARIAEELEAALPPESPPKIEEDEVRAWELGGEESLGELASRLCRHAEGVMCQGTASGPAKLWQLRTVLALDLAVHTLRTAWEAIGTPVERRYLLLSFGGPVRAENKLRQRSEDSFRRAYMALRLGIVETLAEAIREVGAEKHPDWDGELANRKGRLNDLISELRAASPGDEDRLARLAAESAEYGRSADGFRVLLQSIGMLAGTGQYRFLTGSPDLLAALVGALSAEMPMSSGQFFARLQQEWGLVVGQEAATKTLLGAQMDGVELERNARRAEQLMSDAGLALGLSDRTVVVGERAKRKGSR